MSAGLWKGDIKQTVVCPFLMQNLTRKVQIFMTKYAYMPWICIFPFLHIEKMNDRYKNAAFCRRLKNSLLTQKYDFYDVIANYILIYWFSPNSLFILIPKNVLRHLSHPDIYLLNLLELVKIHFKRKCVNPPPPVILVPDSGKYLINLYHFG